MRLLRANVLFALLYWSSIRKVATTVTQKLQACINLCVRRFSGVFWSNTTISDEIGRHMGQITVGPLIRKQNLQWIDLILRKGELLHCGLDHAMEATISGLSTSVSTYNNVKAAEAHCKELTAITCRCG